MLRRVVWHNNRQRTTRVCELERRYCLAVGGAAGGSQGCCSALLVVGCWVVGCCWRLVVIVVASLRVFGCRCYLLRQNLTHLTPPHASVFFSNSNVPLNLSPFLSFQGRSRSRSLCFLSIPFGVSELRSFVCGVCVLAGEAVTVLGEIDFESQQAFAPHCSVACGVVEI
jgi:hypothetical protein